MGGGTGGMTTKQVLKMRGLKMLFCGFLLPAWLLGCENGEIAQPVEENGPVHKIVFAAKDEQGRYKLCTINDDGTGLKEIFANDSHIGDLQVSPQGDRVVCDVNTASLPTDILMEELFIVKIDGTHAIQITHFQGEMLEEAQWFGDGERILFGRFEPYGAQFYLVRVDGSNLTRITTDDSSSHRFPRLSPDGEKVAFEMRNPPYSMWVMNVDGTSEIPLSTPEVEQWAPEWTPDGGRIVFETRMDQGIWIINADGNDRKRLCDGIAPHHVSPVNGEIVFGKQDGLYTIQPDGSGLRKLCSVRLGDYPILWSRDGAKIAFRGDVNGDGIYGLCKINADGSGLKEITNSTLRIVEPPTKAFDWVP
jgi:Tol biopolymer transport system component